METEYDTSLSLYNSNSEPHHSKTKSPSNQSSSVHQSFFQSQSNDLDNSLLNLSLTHSNVIVKLPSTQNGNFSDILSFKSLSIVELSVENEESQSVISLVQTGSEGADVEDELSLIESEEMETSHEIVNIEESNENSHGSIKLVETLLRSESEVSVDLDPIVYDVEELDIETKRQSIIRSLRLFALSLVKQLQGTTKEFISKSKGRARVPPVISPIVLTLNTAQNSIAKDSPVRSKPKKLIFPTLKNDGLGARELACVLKIIDLVIEGLNKNVIMTKRDMYYRDVNLFQKQGMVDNLVDDLAGTLGIDRFSLGVVAASKGLFAGHLALKTQHAKSMINGCGSGQGCLIPPGDTITELETDDVKYVLVVEKEAVFRTLCTVNLASDARLGNGIILTGKGYPDLATRELLKRLDDELPVEVPFLGLVDSDPHGLEILHTYKFGSKKQAAQVAKLAVERIQLLGLSQDDLKRPYTEEGQLIPLKDADRSKAISLLSRNSLPSTWHRELSLMLHTHRKAETEVLASNTIDNPILEDHLAHYVIEKIRHILAEVS